MSRERLGVFGGTFDPPHLGHLILAAEACSKLELKRLLWVPTPVPPHKLDQSITPLEHRLAMVALAIQDTPAFELSRVEIDRPGPHYMVDTLGLLRDEHTSADLCCSSAVIRSVTCPHGSSPRNWCPPAMRSA